MQFKKSKNSLVVKKCVAPKKAVVKEDMKSIAYICLYKEKEDK